MAIKASLRNGRAGRFGVYNSNHNTNKETRDKEDRIDHSRTHLNQCAAIDQNGNMQIFQSFDSKKHEREMYDHYYGDGLKAKNERYIEQRHAERCKDMKDILNSEKTAPFETVLQIGKEGYRCESPETLWEITKELATYLSEKYGDNYKLLDIALHRDETTDHIHLRGTFCHVDKYGHAVPNQSQALKAMGFERPDLTKERSRYNNALISFTDELRGFFYDRCEERGIEIDRTVASASQRHRDVLEYTIDKMQEEIAAKDAKILEQEKLIQQYQKDIQQLGQGARFLTAATSAIERAASTLSQDKSAQIREELPAETRGLFHKEIVKPEGVRVDLDVWEETAQASRGKATANALRSVSAQLSKYMEEAAFLADGVAMREQIQQLQNQIKEIEKQYKAELEREQRRNEYAVEMLKERGVDGFIVEYELRLRERFHNCLNQCENGTRAINDCIIEAHENGDSDLVKKLLEEKRKLPKDRFSIKEMLERTKEEGFNGAINYARELKKLQAIEKLHNSIDKAIYGRVDWKLQAMVNELARIIDAQKAAGGPLLMSESYDMGHKFESHAHTPERGER
jgi:hypothetical protein